MARVLITAVEKVARAMCKAEGLDPDGIHNDTFYGEPPEVVVYSRIWEYRKSSAAAAIAAYEAHLAEARTKEPSS